MITLEPRAAALSRVLLTNGYEILAYRQQRAGDGDERVHPCVSHASMEEARRMLLLIDEDDAARPFLDSVLFVSRHNRVFTVFCTVRVSP